MKTIESIQNLMEENKSLLHRAMAWTPCVSVIYNPEAWVRWRVTGATTPGDLECVIARTHEEDL